MKRKITLKQIARELDVSISTVSKALKDSGEISADTKQKIKAFAKLYNYRPNIQALNLKSRRTHNIGVIIPDIVHYFFTTVFRGIEHYSQKHGYNVIACVSDESLNKEIINVEMLANGSVDGFILALSAETQKKNAYAHLKEIIDQGIPLVLFDRVTDEIECDKVLINDKEAAFLGVKKFIDNGRKKIALITTEDYFSVSRDREAGYRQALVEFGLPTNEDLILKLPYMAVDENAINTFFNTQDVDAVLCVNEIFAIHSMNLVQQKGIKVPEEIAFIGFTDGILSKYANPGLTSIAQHGYRMGEMAAKMLIEKVEKGPGEEHQTFHTEIIPSGIVERGSTIN